MTWAQPQRIVCEPVAEIWAPAAFAANTASERGLFNWHPELGAQQADHWPAHVMGCEHKMHLRLRCPARCRGEAVSARVPLGIHVDGHVAVALTEASGQEPGGHLQPELHACLPAAAPVQLCA